MELLFLTVAIMCAHRRITKFFSAHSPLSYSDRPTLSLILYCQLRMHPSNRYVGKEYASNDMGDGPNKKTAPSSCKTSSRTRSSAPRRPMTPSITKFFAPVPSHMNSGATPPLPPLPAWGAQNRALPPIKSNDGAHIFSSDTLAIALSGPDIFAARTALLAIPHNLRGDIDILAQTLKDFPLAIAIKHLRQDYCTIPRSGLCTPLVVDQLLNGPPDGSLLHPSSRRRFLATLTHVAECTTTHRLTEATDAMARYHAHLTRNPRSDTFAPSSAWMPADLLPALLRATAIPATVWMEETSLPTPFSPPWLPLSGLHDPRENYPRPMLLTVPQLLKLADSDTPHVGYAQNHHFLPTTATAHLGRQVRWLLVNMSAQIIALDTLFPSEATRVSAPRMTSHDIQFTLRDMALFVPQAMLKQLQAACKFTTGSALRDQIRDFFEARRSICCAHRSAVDTPSRIPATGFCSLHALDFINHSEGQDPPSVFPSLSRTDGLITQILDSQHLTSPHREPLSRIQRCLLDQPTLPSRQWPHLSMVAEWANILKPTSLWLDDDASLPEGWLRAVVIPTSSSPATRAEAGSSWTLSDLRCLPTCDHLALANSHFYPTYPSTNTVEELIEGLITAAAEFLATRLQVHHHTVCPPDLAVPLSPTSAPPSGVQQKRSGSPHLVNTSDSQPRLRVSFLPLQANGAAPAQVSYAPLPRPHTHPALCVYAPPEVDTAHSSSMTRRHPRLAHQVPRAVAPDPIPPPPKDDPYYTLASQMDTPDLILVGPATAAGSYYGAYAKQDIEVDTKIGAYVTAQRNHHPICHSTDPTTSNGDYAISIKQGQYWYEEDPFIFDTCAARFADECLTEEEENCVFQVIDGTIWLVATRPIQRYEQLFTRYGHEYWCNSKWPLALLLAMLAKYRPTLTEAQLKTWEDVLESRRLQDRIAACYHTTSILRPSRQWKYDPKRPQASPVLVHSAVSQTQTPSRSVSKVRNKRRRKAKEAHKRAVAQGRTAPLRPLPGSFSLLPQDTAFLPCTWSHTFPTLESEQQECRPVVCRMMSWAIQGRLGATGDAINSGIRQFLTHVAELMMDHRVDIMWLTDARFTAGTLDIYLPILHSILPNCRAIQFPTHYIKTGSRCQSFNRMGGAMAIVTHQWQGYITRTLADPTGSGLINAIDIAVGPYQLRSICPYFLPTTSGQGPASLHTRLRKYLDGNKCPRWARGQTPISYQFEYSQKLISTARLKGMAVFTMGDMNRPPPNSTGKLSAFGTWRRTNGLIDPMAATLHHLPGYHTWRSPTQQQGNTTIDHALHTELLPAMTISDVGTVHDDLTNSMSDHLPIWLGIALSDDLTLPPPQTPIPLEPYVDLDMRKDKEKEEYNVHLTHRLSTLPKKAHKTNPDGTAKASSFASGRFLGTTLSHTSLAVRSSTNGLNKLARAKIVAKCRRKRGSFKHGYSREMMQIKTYLYFYKNVIRLVYPSGRHARGCAWTAFTYTGLLERWHKEWKQRNQPYLCQITKISPVSKFPDPADVGLLPFRSITRQFLQDRITALLSELQGEKRRFMRMQSSPAYARLEEFHANKELGKIIQQLSCRPPDMLDLQSLPCPTRGQITNHYTVQIVLNSYFKDWHAIPKSLDPAADKLARDPDWWHSLLEYRTKTGPEPLQTTPSEENILPLDYGSAIPLPLQDGLRRVCAVKVSKPVELCLQQVLDEPITYDDFNLAINSLTNGGAPGPSGVTVNMIKAWSPSTRKFVHMHMDNIWTARTTPLWFRDKVIKLAPKITGNSELKNMRPISLYEVIRKTWTTIVAKRIHLAWHNNDVLHPAQYGYRLDNGTHMALFNVINQIEDATHNHKTKHITFWDIRRAFDSIPRNMQKLAWTRLGVPLDVAEWFVDLDDGGLSFISSPLYHRDKNLKTPQEMGQSNTHFSAAPELGFQAERGIGQGESASSLMWTALYDILLEWIDPANRHLHVAETGLEYDEEDIRLTKNNAYADDLATLNDRGTSSRVYAATHCDMAIGILCLCGTSDAPSEDLSHHTWPRT